MNTIKKFLPSDVTVQDFSGSLLLVGPNLNTQTFESIMAQIPEPMRGRVIGWKLVTQMAKAA